MAHFKIVISFHLIDPFTILEHMPNNIHFLQVPLHEQKCITTTHSCISPYNTQDHLTYYDIKNSLISMALEVYHIVCCLFQIKTFVLICNP